MGVEVFWELFGKVSCFRRKKKQGREIFFSATLSHA
jgi:hypothetical protein